MKLLALAFAFVSLSLAADVNGKWKADFQGPDGVTRTSNFEFKADGEKLSGKMTSPRGDADISEGAVKGDDVSFAVVRKFNDQEFKISYKGKISGDIIVFKVQFGDQGEFEITAKRDK